MTFLATWLIGRGLSSQAAKLIEWFVAFLLVVLLIVGVFVAWHHWLDDQRDEAVTLDRAQVQAAADNQMLAADRAATANQVATDSAFAAQQQELHDDIIRNATPTPVGPGVRSVLDRVREQQKAGRR